MKKIAFFALILIATKNLSACDICGCGVGGNYIGILPEFHKNILGVRYRTNSLRTHVGLNGTNTYMTTHEQYHTTELWGGWAIGESFRVMASLPYAAIEKENSSGSLRKSGIGDMSVNGYYQAYSGKKTCGEKLLVQSLWLGGGVKIPTGSYSNTNKMEANAGPNAYQLGTGSIDFTAQAMYDIRLQDAGINLNTSYKINAANKQHYRYGNKLTASIQGYYKLRVKDKCTLAPNVGVVTEIAKKDADNKILIDGTGGNLLAGTVGMEVSFKKIMMGANWQPILSQSLAKGTVVANNRGMVHIAVSF